MADHPNALTHVAAIDSTAPVVSEWGTMRWLISGQQPTGSQMTFGHVQIEPGHKNPRHYHPNSDEVLFLIEGELDHSLGDDGQSVHLTAGMAMHIPAGVAHDARNRGAITARMVVAYNTGDRQIVMLEDGHD